VPRLRRRASAPQARPAARLGLGKRRWPVERSNAWLLENKRLALRYDRQGFIVQSLLQAVCPFLVAGQLDEMQH
jgi:transposase